MLLLRGQGTSRRNLLAILATFPAAALAARNAVGMAICDLVGAPVHPASFISLTGPKGAPIMRIVALSAEHALSIAEERMPPIMIARTHCHLVDQIEQCAPEVTATYLMAAYKRMQLGVRIEYDHIWANHFIVYRPGNGSGRGHFSRDEAVADYLNVCDMLTDSRPAAPHAAHSSLETGRGTAAGRASQ